MTFITEVFEIKKLIFSILLFVFCCSIIPICCASAEAPSFSDDPKAIQSASKSVIMLNCFDKDGKPYTTGSAFAAFEDGVFITNYHVIEKEVKSIRAQMETGLEFNISHVVAFNEEKDLAILRTDAKTNLSPLPLGDSSKIERGEKVIAIGSPMGLINTLSFGLYSGRIKEDQEYLQFSAPISQGSSGGALFNNRGEVIGITAASYIEGQNLNFAIPIEDVINLWNKRESEQEMSIGEFYELNNKTNQYKVDYIPAQLINDPSLAEDKSTWWLIQAYRTTGGKGSGFETAPNGDVYVHNDPNDPWFKTD